MKKRKRGTPSAGVAAPAPVRAELTAAEGAVAVLLLAGQSNAAIAGIRRSAMSTVANQVASIFRKLGVCSRGELAARRPRCDHVDQDGRRFAVEPGTRAGPALSQREGEIVAFAALGYANKFIAYELGISEASVSTAMSSAAAKLGARSRVELVGMLARDPTT